MSEKFVFSWIKNFLYPLCSYPFLGMDCCSQLKSFPKMILFDTPCISTSESMNCTLIYLVNNFSSLNDWKVRIRGCWSMICCDVKLVLDQSKTIWRHPFTCSLPRLSFLWFLPSFSIRLHSHKSDGLGKQLTLSMNQIPTQPMSSYAPAPPASSHSQFSPNN